MYEFVLYPVSAFVFFLVCLPLVGLVLGFLMRVCVPYLVAPLVLYLGLAGSGYSSAWWAVALLSLVWVFSILHARQGLKRIHGALHWSEGHCYGAFNIVALTMPLRRKKALLNRPVRV